MIQYKKNLNINSKHLITIINYLKDAGATSRVIGGAVRDSLKGVNVSDIDIATNIEPQEVINIMHKHNVKTIEVGINFGTVMALIDDEYFEITTLRQDISTDGRRATVKYTKSFAEDAKRRDFTINALSYCPINHIIYDYFSGLEDLKNNKVIFIGNAKERIEEDYLRILRFFRFSARYAKIINFEGMNACYELREKLNILSRERIKAEMDLIILLPNSEKILLKMYEAQILQEIFPLKNIDINEIIEKITKLKNLIKNFDDLVLVKELFYATIFLYNEDISFNKLLGYKFSRAESIKILDLLKISKLTNKDNIILSLKNIWINEEKYAEYFLFATMLIKNNEYILKLYNKLKNKVKPNFPINGSDLIKLGYKGKDIGKVLKLLKTEWLNSDCSLSKNKLLNLI